MKRHTLDGNVYQITAQDYAQIGVVPHPIAWQEDGPYQFDKDGLPALPVIEEGALRWALFVGGVLVGLVAGWAL